MPSDDVKQLALLPGQFAWCKDEKSGGLVLFVGPTRLTPTDDDIFMTMHPDTGELVNVGSIREAVQSFITIHPGEYAVIHNPVVNATDDFPNGRYSKDKNTLEPLDFGKTRVLTSGYFPIWPGQRVEVRPVHELSSNQYVVVRVVDASRVDVKAPYYDLTLACAGITKAVVDAQGESEKSSAGGDPQGDSEKQVPGEGGSQPHAPARSAKETTEQHLGSSLTTGQQIVIPGSRTPTYIPPTGIEVVPDTSIDDSARQVTPQLAREMLATFERRRTGGKAQAPAPSQRGGPSHMPADLDPQTLLRNVYTSIDRGDLTRASFASILGPTELRTFQEAENRSLREGQTAPTSLKFAAKELQPGALVRVVKAVSPDFEEPVFDVEASTVGGMPVAELEAVAAGPRLVRQAVVLGPTEFCVLLDADGRPQIHKGPGRVFPGPYDRFRTLGAANRVYNAYHLRSDRGLLIRIVVDRIPKADLKKELPEGLPDEQLGKETYLKGDEVFIGGFDAYLVPSNTFEIIDPGLRIEGTNSLTRSPHIGNDHRNVYVKAIGVDQKSGVYVADVDTGNVELIRGEKKLLLDPRKHRHVKRRVPGKAWNLIIGRAEPHKKVDDNAMVETPWALSVIVPNNEAVLVTSKMGRRVVVGPCTELLGYEEWLEKLTLSRGRPKTEDDKLETCFLRVSGNRVTDQIDFETADFVTITVDVAYGVTFVAETEEERCTWFGHRNYVRLLYTHLRSRLRAAARRMTFMELQPIIPDFVRDVVLGVKPDGGHRPGLSLPNNMFVDEVEVLDIVIPDATVQEKVVTAHRASVTRQIEDVSSQAELGSKKLRDGVAKEEHTLVLAKVVRDEELQRRKIEADDKAKLLEIELRDKRAVIDLTKRIDRDRTEMLARVVQEEEESKARVLREKADLDIQKQRNDLETALKKDLADIEASLIASGAEAAVKQLNALQPGLIAAIEGLGDKQVAEALAQNLPQAGGTLGFLLEAGGLEAIKSMVRGTRLEAAFEALQKKQMTRSTTE